MICGFLVLALCASVNVYAQTNYYVSPTGSDANAGTSLATPWQTIEHAAAYATPGSTVHILAGTYAEIIHINVSGTFGNPITFRNYQQDVVSLIAPASPIPSPFTALILIENRSNIVIQGLTIRSLTCPFANGILVRSNPGTPMENITLRNLKIRNIGFTTNLQEPFDQSDNAHGIEVYGQGHGATDALRNVVIDSCEVFHNINGYSENITLNGNIDGFSITNCSVHGNTNIGIDVAGNFIDSVPPAFNHARNGLVARNMVFDNRSTKAKCAGIYCDGCWNTTIERNISHHNQAGIAVGCEQNGTTDSVIVRNNFVYLNDQSGIEIGGYNPNTTGIVRNSVVRNNTCFHNDLSDQHDELIIHKVDHCQIFQNIFYSDSDLLFQIDNLSPQNYTSDHNLFFTQQGSSATALVNDRGSTMSFLSYLAGTGKDAASIFANPALVDTVAPDLHLQSTSPARNAGDVNFVHAAAEKDIDGENRAVGIVDIGADEDQVGDFLMDGSLGNAGIFIYPNPATETITLLLDGRARAVDVRLYNMLGELVQQSQVSAVGQFGIANLPRGSYFLTIDQRPGVGIIFMKR